MPSDADTEEQFDAFCMFHAAIGAVALLMGQLAARNPPPLALDRFGFYAPYIYELLVLLLLVGGLVMFFGSAGVWLFLTDADAERKQRVMNWGSNDGQS